MAKELKTQFTNNNVLMNEGIDKENEKKLNLLMEKKKNFIKVGNCWVNLDNVNIIEIKKEE